MSSDQPIQIDDAELERFMEESEGQEQESTTFEYHTILKVWQAVLAPALAEMTTRVTPQWAQRIISSHVGIDYLDMEDFRDLYFTRLLHLASFIDEIIDSDPECLVPTTPEEDVAHNAHHYRDLILAFNKEFVRWEAEWHTLSPNAAIDVAAAAEVFKVFFGNQQSPGIVAHLDQIGFQFTEDDQRRLVADLEAYKEGL